MHRKSHIAGASLLLALAAAAGSGAAAAAGPTSYVDPTDVRLVPNPLLASDPGTAWSCRTTGPDVACVGSLGFTWEVADGPADLCSVPLWSVAGSFSRVQTRRFALDEASGSYLEHERLIHLDVAEHWTTSPDAAPREGVRMRLGMTWISEFGVPGDLDSRVTRKQGIDTFAQGPHGGAFLLDVGQKTTIGSDDLDFHGRWDLHLGDPIQFQEICTALGL